MNKIFQDSSINRKEGINGAERLGIVSKTKRAVLFHLKRAAEQSSQRIASKRAAHTNALHANLRQLCQSQVDTFQTHQHIYRSIDRTHHSRDVFLDRKSTRLNSSHVALSRMP